jgi:hypothetical protein
MENFTRTPLGAPSSHTVIARDGEVTVRSFLARRDTPTATMKGHAILSALRGSLRQLLGQMEQLERSADRGGAWFSALQIAETFPGPGIDAQAVAKELAILLQLGHVRAPSQGLGAQTVSASTNFGLTESGRRMVQPTRLTVMRMDDAELGQRFRAAEQQLLAAGPGAFDEINTLNAYLVEWYARGNRWDWPFF